MSKETDLYKDYFQESNIPETYQSPYPSLDQAL